MEDFIASILLSTTLFPGREGSRDKGAFAEAPGFQARKGVSKAIGEQIFLGGVDAVLDVGFDVPCRWQPDPCDFAQRAKKKATHPNPGSVAFVLLPGHPAYCVRL